MLDESFLDTTAVAIIVAVAVTGVHVLVGIYRKITFEPTPLILTFLAVMAIFAGIESLTVAIQGNPEELPIHWREYLALSGVICIGLAAQHFIVIRRKISEHSGREDKNTNAIHDLPPKSGTTA